MMFKEGRLPFASYTALLFLAFQGCNARKTKNNNDSPTSSCDSTDISYPFRLNTDPKTCGDKRYNLHYENNSTVALYLSNSTNPKYYVYNSNTIRVVDAGFDQHGCSSVPRVPLDIDVDKYKDSYFFGDHQNPYLLLWRRHSKVHFVKCANPVNHPLYRQRSFLPKWVIRPGCSSGLSLCDHQWEHHCEGIDGPVRHKDNVPLVAALSLICTKPVHLV